MIKQPVDLVKRLVPTELEVSLYLPRITIRLMTNSPSLRNRMVRLFRTSAARAESDLILIWRIVTEPDGNHLPSPELLAINSLSLDGLAFIAIGRQSFLAWDAQALRGISFIAESLANDDTLFHGYFFPALQSLLPK
jgi:hypothetical protein